MPLTNLGKADLAKLYTGRHCEIGVFASFPIYFETTDVKILDMEVRVFASGDDRSMWDVQYYGVDERPHTASAEQAKAILAHIEANDVSAWGDIAAQARTNPRLRAA